MILFPNAKINVGLFVTRRRPDGFHDLETVFYPFDLCDVLEIVPLDGRPNVCEFESSGLALDCLPGENLVEKAYALLAKDYELPGVHVHLHKVIPNGAGLGGGSADAAFMLMGLNDEVAIEDEPYQEMDVQRLFSLITRDVCDCEGCDGCLEDDEILKECSHHHHHEHCDHHHHHHADEIFEAYSLKTTKTFTRSELEAILKDIKDEVVRAKGIVDSDEYCLYFDISGDDIMISRAKASKSGIVTIISEKVDRPKMEKLFL